MILLLGFVPTLLATQVDDSPRHPVETLVEERIQTIGELLSDHPTDIEPAAALALRSLNHRPQPLAIPSTPSGRPPKLKSISIRIRPEEPVLPELTEVMTKATSWFDWPTIATMVGAGLEHDLTLPPPTQSSLRRHLLEQHGPFLKLALRFRSGKEIFQILDSREHENGDVTVTAELRSSGENVTPLAFRLRPVGSTHLFIDVRIDKFSVLNDLRSWHLQQWLEAERSPTPN